MTRYGLARRIDLVAAWVRFKGPVETDPAEFADVARTLEALAEEARRLGPPRAHVRDNVVALVPERAR